MSSFPFISSFIALMNSSAIFVCENYYERNENLAENLFRSEDTGLWLRLVTSEELDNPLIFQEKRAKTLALCDLTDIPIDFPFDIVAKDITFLLQTHNLDAPILNNALSTLRLDSNVYVYEASPDVAQVTELYRIKRGPMIKRHFGTWTPRTQMIGVNLNKWERRNNLMGIDLIDTWLPWTPFTFFNEETGEVDGEDIKFLFMISLFDHLL